jgi:hypothetical protein
MWATMQKSDKHTLARKNNPTLNSINNIMKETERTQVTRKQLDGAFVLSSLVILL